MFIYVDQNYISSDHGVLSDACSSFTVLQHLAIWGNLLGFYIINFIISAVPSAGMYTIMFRLCGQPSYWITMFVSFPTISFLMHFPSSNIALKDYLLRPTKSGTFNFYWFLLVVLLPFPFSSCIICDSIYQNVIQ